MFGESKAKKIKVPEIMGPKYREKEQESEQVWEIYWEIIREEKEKESSETWQSWKRKTREFATIWVIKEEKWSEEGKGKYWK